MLKIVFTRDAEPHELGADDPRFKTGECWLLPRDKAQRWIRRAKATLAPAETIAVNESTKPAIEDAAENKIEPEPKTTRRRRRRISDGDLLTGGGHQE